MLKDAQNLSRRSFLAGAGVLTAGIAGGALVGCSPKATEPAAGSKEPAAQNVASPSEGAEAADQIWSFPNSASRRRRSKPTCASSARAGRHCRRHPGIRTWA